MVTAIERLIELDAAKPKSIVVIGDALIDVWIHGELFPSQDGCDKFVELDRITTPGGAANAANCLQHWSSMVKFFTAKERSIKTRYIVNEKIAFRHDEELLARYFATIHEAALQAVKQADVVLLCDYDKGFLTESFIQQIITKAKLCVVDAKREPKLFRGAIVKGNMTYSVKYDCIPDVCTDGVRAPYVLGDRLKLELPLVPCVNHVGAGDCFGAHLALGLAHGFSLEDAATVAHSAGRIYVQHQHNRAPYPEEVANDFCTVGASSY